MLKPNEMAFRYVFAVINPVAGRGRGHRAWSGIRSVLRATGVDLAEVLVERPGRAEEVAARAAGQGYDLVVSVGGDGTIHEVLNGILLGRPEHPPVLAVIPGGTGNIFARGLGIPRDPAAAAGLLFHGVRKRVDVGRVNERYFASVAGVGFDAEIAYRAARWPRWIDGFARHIGAGLGALADYRAVEARVTIDGRTQTVPLFFLAAANTVWYGAGIRIAPHARADDGELAIVYGMDLTKAEVVGVLLRTFSGSHLSRPKMGHASAREVHVESDVPMPVQADGEPLGRVSATFRCIPGMLEVLVPRPEPD